MDPSQHHQARAQLDPRPVAHLGPALPCIRVPGWRGGRPGAHRGKHNQGSHVPHGSSPDAQLQEERRGDFRNPLHLLACSNGLWSGHIQVKSQFFCCQYSMATVFVEGPLLLIRNSLLIWTTCPLFFFWCRYSCLWLFGLQYNFGPPVSTTFCHALLKLLCRCSTKVCRSWRYFDWKLYNPSSAFNSSSASGRPHSGSVRLIPIQDDFFLVTTIYFSSVKVSISIYCHY